MRVLFILATLIPFIVYASGEESSTYYAVDDSNKVVVIEFSGENIFKGGFKHQVQITQRDAA